MPRWLIVALVVVCLLWLGGIGMRAFGDDGGEPGSKDPSEVAEEWFGGINSLLPDPAPLTVSDLVLSAPCGDFPALEIAGGKTCRVVVVENGGRRRAQLRLEGGRADLSVKPPRGDPVTRELESGDEGQVELRFDDDGGALELRCRSSSGSCDVRFVE